MAKSDKEKSAEEIRKKIDFLKSMEEKLVELDYKIPFGRFLDRDGVEKYDDPDGKGLFKFVGNGESVFLGESGPIFDGEYMRTGGEYTFTEREQKELDKYIKMLEKLLKKKEKVEARQAKRAQRNKEMVH